MREVGFEVWKNDHDDFFKQTIPPEKVGRKTVVLVSNPPYSIKKQILSHLRERGWRRFAFLLPSSVLHTHYFRELCLDDEADIGFVPHIGRCKFLKADDGTVAGRASFDVGWICNHIALPRSISFEPLS